MDFIIRGYVDQKGDIYFYVGYDFEVNTNVEKVFFKHLNNLVSRLEIKRDVKVFGGMVRRIDGVWEPRKSYGSLEDNLKLSV